MFQTGRPQTPSLFCFFIVIVLQTLSVCLSKLPKNHASNVKGMFVFGSSILDNGNNNFLSNSLAKADYFPYGIDFPDAGIGRFTNGKNVGDVLGQKLKIPNYIPPFSDPSTKGSKIVHGVNYASGGSGILDDTGAVVGNVTSLNEQIINFEKVTLPDLEVQLGNKSQKILSQFLFVVGSGGNDYSLNYFLGLADINVPLEAFTANLTATLAHQLKRLYNLGARKFVLLGINPNGCSPVATARYPMRQGCVQTLNRAFHMFNANLRNLVLDIRPQLPASNLVYVNAYKIIRDIIRSPLSQGFEDATNSCCEVTEMSEGGGGILCKRGGSICTNRNEYVFFDGLHTTEAVNTVIATKAFSSHLTSEVYPFNVKNLSQL